MSDKIHVCVIGAGVNGLASALQILEAFPSVHVTVMGADLTPDTVGDGSAGFWEPYLISVTPVDLVRKWSESTFEYFMKLTCSEEGLPAGVDVVSGYNFFYKVVDDPHWKDVCFGFRHATQRELDTLCPKARHGWFYSSIICSVERYLPWLQNKIQQRGGIIMKRKVQNIQELAGKYDIIVNCSGLGSYHLFGDTTMQPIQGQVLRVTNTACRYFMFNFTSEIDEGADIYIIPGRDNVVLGGTAVKGAWNTELNPETSRKIMERCCTLMPSLKHATVVKEWIGLRPWRKNGVRLERETKQVGGHKVHIVHNYGHSGSGVTLHWGCAEDVVGLVRECLHSTFQARL